MNPKAKKLLLIISVTGLAALLAVVHTACQRAASPHRSSATVEFKRSSLEKIAKLTTDPQWVTNQFTVMAQQEHEDFRWLSPEVIRLESGEWLVYANKCQKEDPRITDTFVARASDGNWYHSTDHFCKGMIVLLMYGQPRDLKTMVAQYHLNRIDPPTPATPSQPPASH